MHCGPAARIAFGLGELGQRTLGRRRRILLAAAWDAWGCGPVRVPTGRSGARPGPARPGPARLGWTGLTRADRGPARVGRRLPKSAGNESRIGPSRVTPAVFNCHGDRRPHRPPGPGRLRGPGPPARAVTVVTEPNLSPTEIRDMCAACQCGSGPAGTAETRGTHGINSKSPAAACSGAGGGLDRESGAPKAAAGVLTASGSPDKRAVGNSAGVKGPRNAWRRNALTGPTRKLRDRCAIARQGSPSRPTSRGPIGVAAGGRLPARWTAGREPTMRRGPMRK
jgi:hypothetical protein